VALTKVDLVDDEDWIDLVEEDVREVLNGTVLEAAPIVRVSARNGQGIAELLEKLDQVLAERPPRPDVGRPRLPVDRVFSIAGFGTVVTGTLSDGHFRVGEEIEILPQGSKGRIRGLQTHKQQEELALPGSRTAVNISGVALEQVKRGNIVSHAGDYQPTRRMDVRFRMLADSSLPLKHNIEVKLFVGSTEVLARVRTLGKEVIIPGDEGWLQLETREPVVVVRGDHYILRRPSPGETLGGGIVVDPNPRHRHKRFTAGLIGQLESLAEGTPADILLQALVAMVAAPLREVTIRSNLEEDDAQQALAELVNNGEIVVLEEGKGEVDTNSDILVATKGYWEQLSLKTLEIVADYHQTYPLRKGMLKEELKSRLTLSPRLFSGLLQKLIQQDKLLEAGPLILFPDHDIRFSPQQEKVVHDLLNQFEESPFSPPSIKDAKSEVGEDVYQAMVDLEFLIPVSHEVVFRREDYYQMVAEVKELLNKNGTLSAAQVRDHFKTSRRYVLAFLEYLDVIGVTIREGDVRRLK
jgi:selenocysteine-specific elongation factor